MKKIYFKLRIKLLIFLVACVISLVVFSFLVSNKSILLPIYFLLAVLALVLIIFMALNEKKVPSLRHKNSFAVFVNKKGEKTVMTKSILGEGKVYSVEAPECVSFNIEKNFNGVLVSVPVKLRLSFDQDCQLAMFEALNEYQPDSDVLLLDEYLKHIILESNEAKIFELILRCSRGRASLSEVYTEISKPLKYINLFYPFIAKAKTEL